jgi:transposase-like protein
MLRPQRERLRGKVEVDETYIGHQEGLRGGRELGDRALVVAAVELRGHASGRVRLQLVSDASGPSLTGFVKANVEPGTTVITDGWHGYAPLSGMGYRHRHKTQGRPERAAVILPRVHRVFGNLKTWLRGTHHGVDNKHLPAYLDEFTFRFYAQPNADGRVPVAARAYGCPQPHHLQGAVWLGVNRISMRPLLLPAVPGVAWAPRAD